MLFDTVNLKVELLKKQKKDSNSLDEALNLLKLLEDKDKNTLHRLTQAPADKPLLLDVLKLDKDRIFTIDTINDICIKYRLRFLDSSHFRSEFPYEAIFQINEFEKEQDVKVQHFKIMAPYDMFQLKDVNEDPLLFAQLSDTSFYLLHKWGNDLKWYRPIVNFPIQSIYSFFLSVVVLAALVSWSFPFDWLNVTKEGALLFRFWLTTHFTIAFFFFFIFLGSISNASFSDSSWNSKYYN